mgnify:CR=1 FL=1
MTDVAVKKFVSQEQHDKDIQETRKDYKHLLDISAKLTHWYFRIEKKQNEARKTIIALGIAIIVEFAANLFLLWFIINAL